MFCSQHANFVVCKSVVLGLFLHHQDTMTCQMLVSGLFVLLDTQKMCSTAYGSGTFHEQKPKLWMWNILEKSNIFKGKNFAVSATPERFFWYYILVLFFVQLSANVRTTLRQFQTDLNRLKQNLMRASSSYHMYPCCCHFKSIVMIFYIFFSELYAYRVFSDMIMIVVMGHFSYTHFPICFGHV